MILIEQVFEGIDKDRDDIITINEFKSSILSRAHPDVKSGRKQEEDIINEFI